MQHAIIDRLDAVALFHQLMEPSDKFGVIRLLGEAKMGKTHLMSKVFPRIAREEYGAMCALVDLRNAQQTVFNYLHAVHDLLGGDAIFPEYVAACEELIRRPKVEVQSMWAMLSSISMTAKDDAEDFRRHDQLLSSKFVSGLAGLNAERVVLLFDAVNDASPNTRDWLFETFLVQVSRLPHVRVVISGRTVPEPVGSIVPHCESFQLLPVTEAEAFIAFCQARAFELSDQSIRDFAKAVRYTPGLFIDLVEPTFGLGRANHG